MVALCFTSEKSSKGTVTGYLMACYKRVHVSMEDFISVSRGYFRSVMIYIYSRVDLGKVLYPELNWVMLLRG